MPPQWPPGVGLLALLALLFVAVAAGAYPVVRSLSFILNWFWTQIYAGVKINHFDTFTEVYGFVAGDEVLRFMAPRRERRKTRASCAGRTAGAFSNPICVKSEPEA